MGADKTIDAFRRINAARHEYARRWKERTGREVVGFLCIWVPEEIMYAAGMLPVRVLGGHRPQDATSPHIYRKYCCFSRDCLAQGLGGEYSYLDGMVTAHGCQHIRQTFHSWMKHLSVRFSKYLYVPNNMLSRSAQDYLRLELADFKSSVEGWSGKSIYTEALTESIAVYNKNRHLLARLYDMRKNEATPISGEEMLQVTLANLVMDKQESNALLEQLLDELPARGNQGRKGRRLMIVGSAFDDPELFRHIEESLGASIVADDVCTGSRYFSYTVSPTSEPITALAASYPARPPCPIYDVEEERRRPSRVLSLAREYKVDHVALIRRMFCESHKYDNLAIEAFLKKAGVSALATDWGGPVHCVQTGCQRAVVKALGAKMSLQLTPDCAARDEES